MPPWTYLGLKEILVASIHAYEQELAARLQTDKEDQAQKATNERRSWLKFNEAVRDFEGETDDPEELLEGFRDGRKRFRSYFVFKFHPYWLIYLRDPVRRVAVPIVFFHQRDRAKRVKELVDALSRVPA